MLVIADDFFVMPRGDELFTVQLVEGTLFGGPVRTGLIVHRSQALDAKCIEWHACVYLLPMPRFGA